MLIVRLHVNGLVNLTDASDDRELEELEFSSIHEVQTFISSYGGEVRGHEVYNKTKDLVGEILEPEDELT